MTEQTLGGTICTLLALWIWVEVKINSTRCKRSEMWNKMPFLNQIILCWILIKDERKLLMSTLWVRNYNWLLSLSLTFCTLTLHVAEEYKLVFIVCPSPIYHFQCNICASLSLIMRLGGMKSKACRYCALIASCNKEPFVWNVTGSSVALIPSLYRHSCSHRDTLSAGITTITRGGGDLAGSRCGARACVRG